MLKNKDFIPEKVSDSFLMEKSKFESWDKTLIKAGNFMEDVDVINIETIEYRLNSSYVIKAIRVWYKE
jgi:hypothetical protein